MDGLSVSTEAAAAIETLPLEQRPKPSHAATQDASVDGHAASNPGNVGSTARRPQIQSDHGSGFIAREFAETLSGFEA